MNYPPQSTFLGHPIIAQIAALATEAINHPNFMAEWETAKGLRMMMGPLESYPTLKLFVAKFRELWLSLGFPELADMKLGNQHAETTYLHVFMAYVYAVKAGYSAIVQDAVLFHDAGKTDEIAQVKGDKVTFPGHPEEGASLVAVWASKVQNAGGPCYLRQLKELVRAHDAFWPMTTPRHWTLKAVREFRKVLAELVMAGVGGTDRYEESLATLRQVATSDEDANVCAVEKSTSKKAVMAMLDAMTPCLIAESDEESERLSFGCFMAAKKAYEEIYPPAASATA